MSYDLLERLPDKAWYDFGLGDYIPTVRDKDGYAIYSKGEDPRTLDGSTPMIDGKRLYYSKKPTFFSPVDKIPEGVAFEDVALPEGVEHNEYDYSRHIDMKKPILAGTISIILDKFNGGDTSNSIKKAGVLATSILLTDYFSDEYDFDMRTFSIRSLYKPAETGVLNVIGGRIIGNKHDVANFANGVIYKAVTDVSARKINDYIEKNKVDEKRKQIQAEQEEERSDDSSIFMSSKKPKPDPKMDKIVIATRIVSQLPMNKKFKTFTDRLQYFESRGCIFTDTDALTGYSYPPKGVMVYPIFDYGREKPQGVVGIGPTINYIEDQLGRVFLDKPSLGKDGLTSKTFEYNTSNVRLVAKRVGSAGTTGDFLFNYYNFDPDQYSLTPPVRDCTKKEFNDKQNGDYPTTFSALIVGRPSLPMSLTSPKLKNALLFMGGSIAVVSAAVITAVVVVELAAVTVGVSSVVNAVD